MGTHVIKMPDIGEGIAQVELVEWYVKVGDVVSEDQVVADVMTDKATVEIPSPVHGTVIALGGQPGEVMAVGSELIRIEVQGSGNHVDAPTAQRQAHATGNAMRAAETSTTTDHTPAQGGDASHAAHTAPDPAAQAAATPQPMAGATQPDGSPATSNGQPAVPGAAGPSSGKSPSAAATTDTTSPRHAAAPHAAAPLVPRQASDKPLASPAVRKRA
ncbi:biotin/lipoyl-containing protein, partial [Pseudomonas sp.]|uniref:biotin/lipoyl-containing protein n=1 Tax=Pseudomonas sp. TaxID=306 RepID=UPI0028A8AEA2